MLLVGGGLLSQCGRSIGEAKIDESDIQCSFRFDHNVSWFDITMYDVVGVHVFEGRKLGAFQKIVIYDRSGLTSWSMIWSASGTGNGEVSLIRS